MRFPPLALAILIALPAAAQAPRLAPSPSRLFAPAASAEVASQRHRSSFVEGGARGAAIGALIGLGVGGIMHLRGAGDGDDPGLQVLVFGVVGALVGFVVGGSLTDNPTS